MSRTWDACPYDGTKLLIMLALCDYANDDGECWPNMKQVASKARCSERYARQCIRVFEKDGWVTTTENRGKGKSNEYQIHENRHSEPVSKTGLLEHQNRASGTSPGHYKQPSLQPSGKTAEIEHQRAATAEEPDAAPTARSDSPPTSGKRVKTSGENENPHLSNQVIRRKMLKAGAREWDVERVLAAENPTRSFYTWEETRMLPGKEPPPARKGKQISDTLDAIERM